MADVRLTPQIAPATGVTPTYTGSLLTTNTYLVRNNGRILLHFLKTGAGDCVVTIDTPGQVGGLDIEQQTITVPATTGDKMISQLTPNIYNDSSGDINITLSEITGLTVAVLQL